MDYTRTARQEKQRQRDFDNGIVYLQVRISEETRDILREYGATKGMRLAEYVRDRLDFIAAQIVRRSQAQHSLPGTEVTTQNPESEVKNPVQNTESQTQIKPNMSAKQRKVLAMMNALGIKPDVPS